MNFWANPVHSSSPGNLHEKGHIEDKHWCVKEARSWTLSSEAVWQSGGRLGAGHSQGPFWQVTGIGLRVYGRAGPLSSTISLLPASHLLADHRWWEDRKCFVSLRQRWATASEGERGEWKSWLKIQHSKKEDHGIRSHHFMQIDGETMETWQTLFSWAPKSLQILTAAMKLKDARSLEEQLWPTETAY